MHQDRTAYIKGLSQLANTYRSKLNEIMGKIGWSYQSLSLGNSELLLEGIDSASSTTTLPKGFSMVEEQKPSDLGESLNQPETIHSPHFGTSSEKLYNEMLAGLSSTVTTKKVKEKSEEERLAEMLEKERNAKRRRVNYRNKIHTKNKSTTEVLRELVKQQMDFLVESALDVTPEASSLSSHIQADRDKTDPEDQVLIPVSVTGNPHLAWKKVGFFVNDVVNRRSDSRERRRRRSDSYESQTDRRRPVVQNRERHRDLDRRHRRNSDDDNRKSRRRHRRGDTDDEASSHRRHRSLERSKSNHRPYEKKHEAEELRADREHDDSRKNDESKRKHKEKDKKHRHSHKKSKKHSRNED